jgi:hypothetical protein
LESHSSRYFSRIRPYFQLGLAYSVAKDALLLYYGDWRTLVSVLHTDRYEFCKIFGGSQKWFDKVLFLLFSQVPWLVLVFAAEKLFYCVYYIIINKQGVKSSPSKRTAAIGTALSDAFIKAFGLGDFVFMVFFLYVAFATFFGAERVL